MKKLSSEQLKRFQASQDAKLTKAHVVIDEKHRKNLQAWIPYDLWVAVKTRVGDENTNMNSYVEQALATYLLLEEEDIERILERHQK